MGLATNSFELLTRPQVAVRQLPDQGGSSGSCRSPLPAGQSRSASLTESITNILAGIGIAFISQEIIFAFYDIHVSPSSNIQIVAWFTAISLVRQFLLRRLFNWFTIGKFGIRNAGKQENGYAVI